MIRLFFRLLKWLFTTIGPYLVGITVGVGFAYWLVSHYADQSDASETWRQVANKVNSFISEIRSTESKAPAPTPAKPPAAPATTQVAQVTPKAPEPAPLPMPMPESTPLAPEPAPTMPEPMAPQPLPPVAEAPPAMVEPAPLPPPLPVEPPAAVEQPPMAPMPYGGAPMPNWNAPPQAGMPPAAAPSAQNDPCSASKNQAQFQACQWQRNCMANLEQSRVMITEGKKRCAQAGYAAQNCLAYYQMLETRLNAQNCVPPSVPYWQAP